MVEGRVSGSAEELLRSALEKIVFFECRVSQLESELRAAVQTAERASADASASHRKAVELEGALAAARGAREESQRRTAELSERVRLLEGERERLLSGLVQQARLAGAPGDDGSGSDDQADLAGFIAELRGEIEELRRFKAAVEAAGASALPAASAAPLDAAPVNLTRDERGRSHATIGQLGDRFAGEGRVGLTARDTGTLRNQLTTESDRVLFEDAIERLRSGDPAARLRAVRRLEALGPRAAAPLLAAAVGREPDAEVKVALLGALARVDEPFAAELAGRALEDSRPAVRAAALDALARLAPDQAETKVLGALGDASPIVRRRAALLLAFSKSAQADDALGAALRDPDGGVARAAAAALSGRPSAAAQQSLARALEHADVRVRRSAAETLGRWSGERVDGDAPDHERRRAARRIAERLAAMAPAEVRSAVMGAAEHGRAPALMVHRYAGSAVKRATVKPSASGTRSLTLSPASSRASPSPHARARTAVVEVAAPALAPASAGASGESGLESAIVAELRAALRGRAVAELAGLLSAQAGQIEESLNGLAARGAVVARGPRWYVG
jgi:hypothetical protein